MVVSMSSRAGARFHVMMHDCGVKHPTKAGRCHNAWGEGIYWHNVIWHVLAYVCTYIYIYIYICIHVYMYTHTHLTGYPTFWQDSRDIPEVFGAQQRRDWTRFVGHYFGGRQSVVACQPSSDETLVPCQGARIIKRRQAVGQAAGHLASHRARMFGSTPTRADSRSVRVDVHTARL